MGVIGLAFYYSDGDGGRRILDTSTNTTINVETQQGTIVSRGKIDNLAALERTQTLTGSLGDLWTINFNDEDKDICVGDFLFSNGESWQHLKTAPNRIYYSLPTASDSIKGGVLVGDGLYMEGEILSAYGEPYMSTTLKGIAKVGVGLKMTREFLNVALGKTPSTIEGAMWLSV